MDPRTLPRQLWENTSSPLHIYCSLLWHLRCPSEELLPCPRIEKFTLDAGLGQRMDLKKELMFKEHG
jgi:hypothetical protein